MFAPNVTGPSIVTAPSVVITPFNVIAPLSELPIFNAPISVELPITPTDVVPVPASRVTVSTEVPAISPRVIFPIPDPVSITKLLPFARAMAPVVKVMSVPTVVKVVVAPFVRSKLSPLVAVNVVAPPPKV